MHAIYCISCSSHLRWLYTMVKASHKKEYFLCAYDLWKKIPSWKGGMAASFGNGWCRKVRAHIFCFECKEGDQAKSRARIHKDRLQQHTSPSMTIAYYTFPNTIRKGVPGIEISESLRGIFKIRKNVALITTCRVEHAIQGKLNRCS